jgi:hypothetical protein
MISHPVGDLGGQTDLGLINIHALQLCRKDDSYWSSYLYDNFHRSLRQCADINCGSW